MNSRLSNAGPDGLRVKDRHQSSDIFRRLAFCLDRIEIDTRSPIGREFLLAYVEMFQLIQEQCILRDQTVGIERTGRRFGNLNYIGWARHIDPP
jgi:hypothetical protein